MTFWKYQKLYPSRFFLFFIFLFFWIFFLNFFFNPCIDDRWSVKSLNGFNNNSFLLQHFAEKTSNHFITGVLGFKLFQSHLFIPKSFFLWTFHSGKSSFWSPSMICIPQITIFISILISTMFVFKVLVVRQWITSCLLPGNMSRGVQKCHVTVLELCQGTVWGYPGMGAIVRDNKVIKVIKWHLRIAK